MRAKIAGLPRGARLALGLLTAAMLGFFGMTFREGTPVVGYGLLAAAGLRLVLWLRELKRFLAGAEEG